jgi:hypothetical protein
MHERGPVMPSAFLPGPPPAAAGAAHPPPARARSGSCTASGSRARPAAAGCLGRRPVSGRRCVRSACALRGCAPIATGGMLLGGRRLGGRGRGRRRWLLGVGFRGQGGNRGGNPRREMLEGERCVEGESKGELTEFSCRREIGWRSHCSLRCHQTTSSCAVMGSQGRPGQQSVHCLEGGRAGLHDGHSKRWTEY